MEVLYLTDFETLMLIGEKYKRDNIIHIHHCKYTETMPFFARPIPTPMTDAIRLR